MPFSWKIQETTMFTDISRSSTEEIRNLKKTSTLFWTTLYLWTFSYANSYSASHSFDNKALYVKYEQPSLNKVGGLRHNCWGPKVLY